MPAHSRDLGKILFITLSNLGDAVLTTPVLEALHREFPAAKFTVIAGPKCADLFESDPIVEKIIVYQKDYSLFDLSRFARRLRRERFDAVVDLKHTLFPFVIGSRRLTKLVRGTNRNTHAVIDHLSKLNCVGPIDTAHARFRIVVSERAWEFQRSVWNEHRVREGECVIGINPHAASSLKMWYPSNFIDFMRAIGKERPVRFVIVGGRDAIDINTLVAEGYPDAINLTGRTTIPELASVVGVCNLLVTNDSGPLHFASAFGVPTVAIFGPSNSKRYGPFGNPHIILQKDLSCVPCEEAQCPAGQRTCIDLITVDEVLAAARKLLPPCAAGGGEEPINLA